MSTLQSNVSTLQSNVSTLQSDVTSLDSRLDIVETTNRKTRILILTPSQFYHQGTAYAQLHYSQQNASGETIEFYFIVDGTWSTSDNVMVTIHAWGGGSGTQAYTLVIHYCAFSGNSWTQVNTESDNMSVSSGYNLMYEAVGFNVAASRIYRVQLQTTSTVIVTKHICHVKYISK